MEETIGAGQKLETSFRSFAICFGFDRIAALGAEFSASRVALQQNPHQIYLAG
jgi:hypothetical protein